MSKAAAMTESVLWSTTDGIRCIARPYDDTRYQLRLLRAEGTIKADLFHSYAAAVAAAEEWLDRERSRCRL
jgi:hypothetical protein